MRGMINYNGMAAVTKSGEERLAYFWCHHQKLSIESLNHRSTYRFANEVCNGSIVTPDIVVDNFKVHLSYNKESFRLRLCLLPNKTVTENTKVLY